MNLYCITAIYKDNQREILHMIGDNKIIHNRMDKLLEESRILDNPLVNYSFNKIDEVDGLRLLYTKVKCLRKSCQYHSKNNECTLDEITIGEHSGICVNYN